jgi:predicted lipoprotein with Yx(FWY)xxD motif
MSRSLVLVATLTASLLLAGFGCDEDDESTAGSPRASSPGKATTKPEAGAARAGTSIKLVSSRYGRVIADRRGEALYLFTRDRRGPSRCYGDCATAWPPLLTRGSPRAVGGLRRSRIGTVRRRDGKRQVTYNGHPLYYYKDDSPGRILCHNVPEFGGTWLVVNSRGAAVQ